MKRNTNGLEPHEESKIVLSKADKIIFGVSAAVYGIAVILEEKFGKRTAVSSSFAILAVGVFLVSKAIQSKKSEELILKKDKLIFLLMLTLLESASAEVDGDVPENDSPAPVSGEEKAKPAAEEKRSGEVSSGVMTAMMVCAAVLGVALALFLFKVIPETLYELLTRAFPVLSNPGYGYSLIRAAFTGVVKIIILVAYMAIISLMKDIKRTFMYHGAEHKTIFCYEKGLELTVENVRMQKRFHPRCGTSFLILMVLVSIFITMFIPSTLVANRVLNVVLRSVIGVLLLPIIMGIGYELLKLAGRHDNLFTRIISAPGQWLQHITTREPDDGMIECAIAALKKVIPDDGSDRW